MKFKNIWKKPIINQYLAFLYYLISKMKTVIIIFISYVLIIILVDGSKMLMFLKAHR